jgi:hypothetical protein
MALKKQIGFLSFILLVAAMFANPMALNAGGLQVMVGGKVLKNGGKWFTPLNSASNKIALFSEQREGFSLYNRSGASMTIDAIKIIPEEVAAKEEYILQDTGMKPKPLYFQKTTVQPGKRFDFYVRYYPVQSRHLKATVNITYNGSEKLSFEISGKGRDKAIFNSKSKTLVTKLFGGPLTDEMVTGMVMDKKGRVFFAGQTTGVKDRFAYDIFYGCINPDNTLAWAKLWHGPYRDYSRDSGQNAETGGSAKAIGIDEKGFVYITGSVSPSRYNNNYAVLTLKINPETGVPVWEKLWRPAWPGRFLAKHSAEAYSLDIKNGRVYITGTTGAGLEGSDALILLLSLSTKDGSLKYQYYLDPIPKTNDRGYAVKADGKGNIYVGGLMGKYGVLLKLTEKSNRSGVKLVWAKEINMGWGSNINCLDTDALGNIYISCDRRGAKTFFSIIKMSPGGKLLWGKSYKGGSNKNNNVNVVKVIGNSVYVGGRTGQSWYDSQMGDAKILKLDASSGKELWSAYYYNGKGPDEICEHRVKGLAIRGDELVVVGQVYSGSLNGVRYWGYWYNGVSSLTNYKPRHIKDINMKGAIIIKKGKVKGATSSRKLVDLTDILPFQDADKKHNGKAPDGDLIFWRLKMK